MKSNNPMLMDPENVPSSNLLAQHHEQNILSTCMSQLHRSLVKEVLRKFQHLENLQVDRV